MIAHKIEVDLTPIETQYFWCLLKDDGDGWYNIGCGWEHTPEDAFKAALDWARQKNILPTHPDGEEESKYA